MKLFHTSPEKIEKISKFSGLFGEFLFFAGSPYSMSVGPVITYSIEINKEEILEQGALFFRTDGKEITDIIEETMDLFDVDEDTARDLLDETKNTDHIEVDPSMNADLSWELQHLIAQAAQKLGYRGVEVLDEQGTSWMIAMHGKENDLKLVEEC